jgi:hypothetical protein
MKQNTDTTITEEAKSLFFKYNGSHFLMAREGKAERYLSFQVTKEQELEWSREKIKQSSNIFKDQLVVNHDVHGIFSLIKENLDYKSLNDFISLIRYQINHLDTFTHLLLAEELLTLVAGWQNKSLNQDDIISATTELIEDLIERASSQPISVNLFYKTIPYLSDILTENNIKDRICKLKKNIKLIDV